MTSKRYARYQDSGVEWLGRVPDHWTLRRLGYYFEERREKVSDAEFAALSVTKNGIVPQLETAAKTDDGDNRKRVSAGDFVINSRSDRKGSSGVSDLDGSVSLINTVLVPRIEVQRSFVHHLLRSPAFQEEYYRFGRGIVADLWSTNYAEMRNILLAVPPVAEQLAIGAHLDCEIAKIDTLVEEQRSLIELLKEKRQALISQAVTKGLNPNVPMRDSGVEWLGKVPAHWNSGALRWYAKCGSGAGISTEDVEDFRSEEHAVPVIGGNGLMGFTAQASLDQTVLAVGRVGALCGNVHIVPPPSWVTDNALVVRPAQDQFRLPYIAAVLRARGLNDIAAKTAQPLITGTQVMDQRVPIPPLSEQDEIDNFIDAHATACDALIEEARNGSRLLLERRSALISAAVTGKIDVRGLAPQPEAAAV